MRINNNYVCCYRLLVWISKKIWELERRQRGLTLRCITLTTPLSRVTPSTGKSC